MLFRSLLACLSLLAWLLPGRLTAEPRHSPGSRHPTFSGLVMCGYQGWFRAEGDASGAGWRHFCRTRHFDATQVTFDLWPDVSEYPRTYPTTLKRPDGTVASLFSSWDESTVETHFRWMEEYGIDGVFMQRFFEVTRTAESRRQGRVILANALKASRKHGRAIAVMYDLSGLRAGEDCSSIIQDWKELVDQLKLASQGPDQAYLYHQGKPLVAIWGVGFADRPYNLQDSGIGKLLEFLRHDPDYGGCSILLGVPAGFRTLTGDCVHDPDLHPLLAQANVVMPWMVGRYSSLDPKAFERYEKQVRDDLAWCRQRQLDYVPSVYPGFSWSNLTRTTGAVRTAPLNQIPRQQGQFYWGLLMAAIKAGAPMVYVAMFDEIDEGTAIFKCASRLPLADVPARFLDYEGVPADYYLRLTGQAGLALRSRNPDLSQPLPIPVSVFK